MAESASNQYRPPSGHDEDFVEAVDEDFQCLIYHLPLKEPVLTRCDRRYCKGCLDEHIRGTFCLIKQQKERFSLLESDVQVVAVNGLGNTLVQRRLPKQHESIECVWRIPLCIHWSERHPACKMQNHIKQCSKFPVTRPNNCGRSISRDMVSTVLGQSFPVNMQGRVVNERHAILLLPIISSKVRKYVSWLKDIHCFVMSVVQRQEMESHLESSSRVPFDLVYFKLNNTEDELKNTKAELSETKDELNATKDDLRETIDELNETKDELSETKDELKRLQLSSIKHTNSFLWRINGLSEIFKQAKTDKDKDDIYSEPFYAKTGTESYGYKLKVNVCPNGHDVGEKTHLSVYIFIMKGEYDTILPWPFTERVKFTLIDQQEDPDQRQNKTSEIVGEDNEYFARPVTDKNSGWGFPKFTSHEEIYERRLVVDDTLFLQIDIRSPSS
ncbi:TNF receptor-associated factor 4 [Stylophora pistillata]|uniref:TNF receptor-associated factor 4 n=1 Tax=Stylophora pistillata TaxID=50429 RepID=A0A2B4RIE2_STYPI|nr:TNF receptor-associated factor 4 [Stylophora pistillata]